ncbi:MAG: hypothetical protein ACYC24_01270 [Desulfobacteria bacterium]
MKRMVGLLVIGGIALFAMVGCGGGDGGGSAPSVTAPSKSLQGTYTFVGFDVDYSNGTTVTTVNENSPVITSWSGTMEFGTNTLSQSFVINNKVISLTGSMTITWTIAGVSGIAHVTDKLGTHDLPFTISGTNLTTCSGVIPYGSPGLTVAEYDYWTKVSDSVSPAMEGSVIEK